MSDKSEELLERIAIASERTARELKTMRELMIADVNARTEAESEVPERMRRFGMYMHDVHHIMWMDQENGQEPPEYVKNRSPSMLRPVPSDLGRTQHRHWLLREDPARDGYRSTKPLRPRTTTTQTNSQRRS